jgi:lauroyl/myristoyl acyltransferase
MEAALYYSVLTLIKVLQLLPLKWVAWTGRRLGALAYWVDQRHRRTALQNLTRCFGREKTPAELRALAKENFRRLGENYCAAIKTAAMPWAQLQSHLQFTHLERVPLLNSGGRSLSGIVAIGHFGNFELYARFGEMLPGVQCATTYRALQPPALNRLLQSLRQRSQCLFFERRTEAQALKAALSEHPILLGLLADQHAGRSGARLPFFGMDCSTSTAPAVLALRYGCRLFTGFCFRVGLAKWEIEAGGEIPTHENGHARRDEAIMADINEAFEAAVRRDPANWFWVHKRWKLPESHPKRRNPNEQGSAARASLEPT